MERAHRSLNAYLRAFTAKNKSDWDQILKFATFVYNNTIHTTTGYTPHELAHGFKIQIPTQLTKPKITYNYDSLADMTRNNIAKTLELAKEHLYNKKIINKQYYDRDVCPTDIKIDDLILIKSPVKKHKFQDVYEDLYRVIDVHESYLEYMKGNKRMKIHKNFTKKAQADYDIQPPVTTPCIAMDETDLENNFSFLCK